MLPSILEVVDSKETSKQLKNAHNFEEIFDNYQQGAIPYKSSDNTIPEEGVILKNKETVKSSYNFSHLTCYGHF